MNLPSEKNPTMYVVCNHQLIILMDHNQLWFSPNQPLLFLAINHTKPIGTTRFPIFYHIVHSGPCTCCCVPTCPSAQLGQVVKFRQKTRLKYPLNWLIIPMSTAGSVVQILNMKQMKKTYTETTWVYHKLT